ncbi:zinc-binding metallopeptidase family protein [Wenxinia saemankumensis]|uniref:Zinc-ribbon domain-containing protein n=1 Tax=Wenxinia saemankumensis TaxID=1447782 RepID=A0A1M6BVQ5_9RHOB|nr:putative zinc-binding peptidase [Wenxinia saemankumensis]SHI52835.1 hypothetical protein SAMN05444417_0875 [Wenxinia saemankumensis]
MQLFHCPACGQTLHFENTRCLNCGRDVGYDPDSARMEAVEPDGPVWRRPDGSGGPWRFCENWELSACNWLVPAGDSAMCRACRHNRTIPGLADPGNLLLWQKMEGAKRRLIYALLRLGQGPELPGPHATEPVIFDFPADLGGQAAMTGHADGVITIALAEADDAERERRRTQMHEPYRTLLGHFRHEIGHWYWDRLIRDGGRLEAFRALFGDDRADYAEALRRNYEVGPPADWQARHVSTYAASHPWEDWAETFAHYLHIVDAMEMAQAMQISVGGSMLGRDPYRGVATSDLLSAWMPLSLALNGLNRTVGLNDPYPFVLSDEVRRKLAFVAETLGNEAQPAA